ncbi:MAG: RsmB/NOP family class I SAM-dependent RNA methyltransferase [Hyphomicrobium sp.]
MGSDKPKLRAGVDTLADGLAARDVAASALFSVFVESRAFDDAFAKAADARRLSPRDRAFSRLIASTVLRQRGALNTVIGRFLEKPLPVNQGRLEPILLCAAAQLLILNTPPHAAISLAVDQCRVDKAAKRFDKLANAVLRKVATAGPAIFAGLDSARHNIPTWMFARWTVTYGAEAARAIAEASLREAPLDLTVKGDAKAWAEKLSGVALPTGSVRLHDAGRIEELADYASGDWWVQDAAAALPAKLFGDLRGRDAVDLCAAPGGKTAQLAMLGARVTAVDKSPGRLKRLAANLTRLGLEAEVAVADAAVYDPGRMFDAVLIDAPCTATGTIRRHPDIMYLKRPDDVAALAELQAAILRRAAALVKPGGTLVYCTCSLEPEEGASQIERFLAAYPAFARRRVTAVEIVGHSAAEIAGGWLTAGGDLRTLPSGLESAGGMDGFYAARLIRAH